MWSAAGAGRVVVMTSRTARQALAPSRPTRTIAAATLLVGALFTGVSLYWALGGTWLLDTVGVVTAGGSALIWAAVLVKVVATVLPLQLIRVRPFHQQRALRMLVWAEAIVLTGYGLVLSVVGWLVQAGVISASATADHRALAWHAFLWDPWFLLWGLLVTALLLATRPLRNGRAEQ